MSSVNTGSVGGRPATLLIDPRTTGPASAVVVLRDSVELADGARLQAELDGRMAVGTQVLIVEVGDVQLLGTGELSVLVNAATRLQDEHSGSMVLRNASARLLGQLRLMRLDHKFELEI
ncbi:MAG: hypothetical protein M3137_05285 [Actinomycetota bacterium]|nr:hypothetical protein [Actinomycetota bacterium]